MKQETAPRIARALAPFLCATALVSTPVLAQDAQPATAAPQTTVTPPPVVPTVTPSSSQSSGQTSANGIGDPNSPTPIAPSALAQAEADLAAHKSASPVRKASAQRTVHTTTTRTVTHATEPASQAAPAQTAAPSTTPVAATPQPVQPAPQPQAAQPATTAPATTQTQSSTVTQSRPVWPWAVGGLVVLLGLIAAFTMRGRRRDAYEEEYVPVYAEPESEPAYEPAPEPVAVAPVRDPEPARFVAKPAPAVNDPIATVAPVMVEEAVATPAAPDEVTVAKSDAEDVAALTGGEAPVADRPWLELAMRPLRAGTNVDEALVEIELTVGNAGTVSAEDVRVSTFMLSANPSSASEMESLLVEQREDAAVPVKSIAPGEGKTIDATLALLKSQFVAREDARDSSFQPVIVAEARYRLPGGGEGRTSASFVVGVTPEEGEGFEPFSLARPSMHENIEARLANEPVHA